MNSRYPAPGTYDPRRVTRNFRGTLHPSIVLAGPNRVICGPQDAIKGHVRLRYSVEKGGPPSDVLQPVPCTITLVLSGYVKVEFNPVRYTYTSDFTHTGDFTAQLFKTTKDVYQGDVGGLRSWSGYQSGTSQDYAFSMSFPDFISDTDLFDRPWGPIPGSDEPDKFDFDSPQHIPPSMRLNWSTHVEFGPVVEVQYELRVLVEVHDPFVGVEDPEYPTRIEYERLWIGKSLSADLNIRFGSLAVGKICIDKSGSAPGRDSQGRQSFRVKASALLRRSMNTPKRQDAMYNWQISCPSYVHRKQPLLVQIQMQGSEDHDSNTLSGFAVPPRLSLPVLELVKVVATVDVRIEAQGEPSWIQEEIWRAGQQCDKRLSIGLETVVLKEELIDDSDGTTAHFNAANGWSQLVCMSSITTKLTSSFKTPCIRRSYVIKVRCFVRPVGTSRETFEFGQEFDLVVHPPLADNKGSARDAQPSPKGIELVGSAPLGSELESGMPVSATRELDSESMPIRGLDSKAVQPLAELEATSLRATRPAELDSRQIIQARDLGVWERADRV